MKCPEEIASDFTGRIWIDLVRPRLVTRDHLREMNADSGPAGSPVNNGMLINKMIDVINYI